MLFCNSQKYECPRKEMSRNIKQGAILKKLERNKKHKIRKEAEKEDKGKLLKYKFHLRHSNAKYDVMTRKKFD